MAAKKKSYEAAPRVPAELRERYEEHRELEQRLEALQQRMYLSPEEELEKKRLQKLKLAGKDRIMEILSRHRA